MDVAIAAVELGIVRARAVLVETLGGHHIGDHRDLRCGQHVRDLGGGLVAETDARHGDHVGPVRQGARHRERVTVAGVVAELAHDQTHGMQATGAVGPALSSRHALQFVDRPAARQLVGHRQQHPDGRRGARALLVRRAILPIDHRQHRRERVQLESVRALGQSDAVPARLPGRAVRCPARVAGERVLQPVPEGEPGTAEHEQRGNESQPHPVRPRARKRPLRSRKDA
ncbi:hypothetical protein NBRGN_046_00100 [Nocardia brasiliensis NBRC 14402]|uniref:hypothetical protein n=1 Tax=Nocardia brasiliensis TaxID=37326 RepID=UPI00045CFDE1|nr:hypothetical protein [Nocardia brasiliensis]GAJ82045.1 hypothetical protein NBRGN_046_00100 [Nocardia brasiliensis NBRC 14402]